MRPGRGALIAAACCCCSAYIAPPPSSSLNRIATRRRARVVTSAAGSAAVKYQHQHQHQRPPGHRHADSLSPEDAWISEVDMDTFRDDMRAIGAKYLRQQGNDDVAHLRKMCLWSNACAAVGLLSMGPLPLNFLTTPITVFALSLWTFSRWATIAHHACHGGYNNCRSADPSGAFHSRSFAVGSLRKRVTQWFDWMLPEAWSVEHNNLHHYRLGEEGDPDNVQRNLAFVRTMAAPKAVKYLGVAFLMTSWKWFYYAPNTYKELVIARMRRRGEAMPEGLDPRKEFTLKDLFLRENAAAEGAGADPASGGGVRRVRWFTFADFFRTVMGPYMIGHFLAIPACLLLVGAMVHGGGAGGLNWAAGWVWFQRGVANLVLADVLTNIHAFVAIMPNHCGDDLYAFADRSVKPNSASFYLRQVVSSANFRTTSGGRGSDLNDFMHGWLNYGIEHHLFPNLSALSARRCHTEVKECCARHGVPYVQETVLKRLRKTIAVMVGDASMREFPPAWEPQADRMAWGDQLSAATAAEMAEREAAEGALIRPQQGPSSGRLSLAG